MLQILCLFIVFMCFWHESCSYHYSNGHDIFKSFKTKAKKYHPPPPAHRMYPPPPPPPAPANPSQPPAPTGRTKSPSTKPGQAPLAVVESEAAFTLYHGRNFKVIQNLFYNFTYLLLQQVGDSIGKDWDLNISVFPDPLTNFTLDTSSAVGFLELLGCVGKLKGVPVSFGVASPCISQLILQGTIPTVELDNSSVDLNATSLNVTFEALFGSSTNVQLPGRGQNQSNYVSFDSSIDRGPLQRAEWIKFLASFVDMEQRANIVYDKIQSNYQCLNASGKGNNVSKPLVAWASYSMDLGVWTFSNDPYKLQLNLDAGGLNLDYANLSVFFNMSIEANVEDFHTIASTLDVMIDETYIPDPSGYTWDNLTTSANITDKSAFPFLVHKRLWRHDKRIGINNALDWMEGANAQPQVVLRDLIEVLYPPLNDGRGYNITYFRNIAIGESFVNTTTSECPRVDMTSALEPTIIPCTNQSRF
ncbi:hypothetical protein GOP47_0024809 [Adiantum capillus-veneris]|uniref:Uncharacterized protein n=1 Tax=Adiantum capillus-veneris TaxID=13818 RepID=A0A9D4U4Q1_ADICA|nr:hypothetical protein GOP47_0024809 [Adiantum capillus-veneris]